MQHEKDMAVLHLEEDRARAEQSNVSSREMNVSRTFLPKTPMLPRFKESEGSIDAYLRDTPAMKGGVATVTPFI